MHNLEGRYNLLVIAGVSKLPLIPGVSELPRARVQSNDGDSTRPPWHNIKSNDYTTFRLFINCPLHPSVSQLNLLGLAQLNIPIYYIYKATVSSEFPQSEREESCGRRVNHLHVALGLVSLALLVQEHKEQEHDRTCVLTTQNGFSHCSTTVALSCKIDAHY